MKKITKKLLSLLSICLILYSSSIMAQASYTQNYTLYDYKTSINNYNTTYGTTFAIVDYDAFYANVYNKMSPDDLVKSLSDKSYSLEIEKEPQYDAEYIIQAEPNQAIRYNQTIKDGGYSGTVFATIETRFPNANKRYFVKYINSGYAKKSSGYYLSTTSTSCVSCSSTCCVVKYQGSWVNAKTGICDCVLKTYSVPFTP
ncbi:hypothetical protein SAMN04487831_1223 [Pseudobutyrivibrio sp. UC1225]|uniref:hypothetical protein n=1 Tax=Pseudobutyrivibrio sp. UC1225 TaxID=1798185 RepID=UPI0008EA2D89|nr:hypothetical protein [Pseudobutyrivibrio sp. UC1225]SFO33885.1 hypothetical protein SAMN04487831_1223 [Pseudobutyrivibrio sp. UC1225]